MYRHMPGSRTLRTALCLLLAIAMVAPSTGAVAHSTRPSGVSAYAEFAKAKDGFRPNVRVRDAKRLNVKWAPGVPKAQIDAAATRLGFKIIGTSKLGWVLVEPARKGLTVGELATSLRRARLTSRISEERIYTPATGVLMPNDPRFSKQWGLHNTGQDGGTADADIDAPEAWSARGTGSKSIVVAVTDTGVDYRHEDLAANMWVNTREIPNNGRDDDRNGYVDDRHGYDFYNRDATVYDPADGDQHGTHVAGIIGAVGHNAKGISGVNWNVTIMPVKFLGPWGGGDFEAAESIVYAVDNGADVINASWGGPYSEVLEEAVNYAAEHGVLIFAAAGNWGRDQDAIEDPRWRNYPSSYEATNVVAVAATDRDDKLTWWSNYGATLVDVAAPGEDILSTLPYEDTALYIEKLPYRIVYNPFALEALEPADARDQMIARSVARVGAASSTPILVVDDSMATMVEDTPGERLSVYTAALAAAGYTNVTTWNTETQGTPPFATLRGKVVVWFTGRTAYGWYEQETVNAAERAVLTRYLDNGGRLVMASGELATDMLHFGADWEWFDTYFHCTLVDIMTWGSEIVGRAGRAFAGITASIPKEYQDWETQFAPTGSDSIIPATPYATPMARIGGYAELSGTSMAAPMAAGTAALLMSALPGAPADDIRARIENTVDVKPSLKGKVAYDGRINLSRAFDAYPGKPTLLTPKSLARLRAGQTELVKWRPAAGASPDATFTAEYGIPVLSAEEGFESGDLAGFETTATDDAHWFATDDPEEVNTGSWAIRSGDVPPGVEEDGWIIGSVSVVETTVVVPDGGGIASFWWWWDADPWMTAAVFEIDDRVVAWPWETFDWKQERFALAEGERTLRWTFVRWLDREVGKDGMGIDDVRVTAWDFDSIGDAPAGTTSLDWTVPGVDTYDARVRVRANLDGASSLWSYANNIRISTDVSATGPVTSLTATPDGDGRVELSWINPLDPDFERVKVLRRSDVTPTGPNDPDATVVYEGPSNTATDGPLAHGTGVKYAAFAADTTENWSEAATATAVVLDTVAPDAPEFFTASMFEGAPAISWMNPAPGSFEKVKVLRKTTGEPEGPNDPDATLVYEGSAAYAIDHVLAEEGFLGTAHYGGWAIDLSGNVSAGVFSSLAVDTQPPVGEFVLNGDDMYTGSALVTGESSVTDATHMRFHINGEYDEDAEWQSYAATSSIQLLEIDGLQFVTAEFRDAAGNTLELQDDIYVNLDPPEAPTGVKATVVGAKVKLSWDEPSPPPGWDDPVGPPVLPAASAMVTRDEPPVEEPWETDIVGYKIWKSASPHGPWKLATPLPIPGTEWLVGGLTIGQKYYFRVTAIDAVDLESEPSEIVFGVPEALIVRSHGHDRYATSAAIARRYWRTSNTVIIATGANFADALGASALAGCYEAPILLTRPGALSGEVVAEIRRLGARNAVIIGGTAAVSPHVAGTLRLLGLNVTRLSGNDRWETAARVAAEVVALQGDKMTPMAFLVNGSTYADAMSAAPIAYRQKIPILLTKQWELPAPSAEFLMDNEINEVLIVGGRGAVSADVAEDTFLPTTRIWGYDRYETAAALASWAVYDAGLSSFEAAGVASGRHFADGLSGGPALGKAGGVMLFTEPVYLPDATFEAFAMWSDDIARVHVFGGHGAVSKDVTSEITSIIMGD